MLINRIATVARVALALIRLFNGGAALLTPRALAGRLGVDTDSNPAIIYPFRLFGIRTIVIGLELLMPDGRVRRHAVRVAPIIHGTDAVTAWLTVFQSQLPPGPARTTAVISTVNTILALIAQADGGRSDE
jgi:hypothetical protein